MQFLKNKEVHMIDAANIYTAIRKWEHWLPELIYFLHLFFFSFISFQWSVFVQFDCFYFLAGEQARLGTSNT